MCTATEPHVHCNRTTCALQQNHMCTATEPHVHCNRTKCALQQNHMCTAKELHVHCNRTTCALQQNHMCTATETHVHCNRTTCALQFLKTSRSVLDSLNLTVKTLCCCLHTQGKQQHRMLTDLQQRCKAILRSPTLLLFRRSLSTQPKYCVIYSCVHK